MAIYQMGFLMHQAFYYLYKITHYSLISLLSANNTKSLPLT